MRIDNRRHDRLAGEIDACRVRGNAHVTGATDLQEAVATHHERRILDRRPWLAGDQPRALEDGDGSRVLCASTNLCGNGCCGNGNEDRDHDGSTDEVVSTHTRLPGEKRAALYRGQRTNDNVQSLSPETDSRCCCRRGGCDEDPVTARVRGSDVDAADGAVGECAAATDPAHC
jgi:hypothetical protein